MLTSPSLAFSAAHLIKSVAITSTDFSQKNTVQSMTFERPLHRNWLELGQVILGSSDMNV